jgi:S-DNA-T family DNA segregation ATPase FtsK/SpoIIIE
MISATLGYLIYISDKTIQIIRKAFIPETYKKAKKQDSENVGELPNIIDGEDFDENTVSPYEGLSPDETATTIEFNDINNADADLDELRDIISMEITNQDDDYNDDSSNAEDSDFSEKAMTITKGKEEEQALLDETRQLEPYDPKLDLENYKYPTIDLLKHYDIDTSIDMEEQQQNKNRIIQVLSDFGVKISSIKATVGPTITLYEITPAPGVRISKIRNLEDDIALSLSALGIRIIAPIPGKGTIGIEVPNARPQIVSMESIINSRKFQETQYELPMALGKTITNELYMVDLAKMPHLLVAGATGQGKSVGLNAIITSLLYKKHPAELKLVMVDPKKVEFSVYSPIINHFLAQVEGTEDEEPIITDVQKVVQTLKSLCVEMDNRYDLLKKAGARNLREYNEKFKSRHLNPEKGHRFMPYIVVIIDEFGDLIMTAGKEIELPICRIAQLARAVGIHMIIATQRPTTNIITGTIKANFPGRMAFKVSAMVDSRTILDRAGAQQLVGKGDMLVLSGAEPVRVQCAFVDTPEVEAICKYIACQQSYMGPAPLPPVALEGEDGDGLDVDMQNLDPMFEEVARLVVQTQQGSTSMIQRKFSIGYNRAGRLMDQLEAAGIVGAAHGSKPREVLCISEEDLQFRLDNMR